MNPALPHDTLTPIMAVQLAPNDLVGGRIIDFVGDARHARVSHVFHESARQSMMRTVRILRGRDPEERAKIEAFVKDKWWAGESAEYFTERFGHLLFDDQFRYTRIVSAATAKALQAADPQERQSNISTLYATFLLDKGTTELAARLSVEQQCQAIADEEHLDPTQPDEVSPFLAALHRRQKRAAYALGETGVSVFREVQEVIRNAQASPAAFLFVGRKQLYSPIDGNLNHSLCQLWRRIEGEINIAHPAALAPNYDIRAWMNDPANAQAFDTIQQLSLANNAIILPEIGRLRELRSLRVNGAVRGLPQEIRNLQNLRNLFFDNSRFIEFPEEIRALQRLTRLSIGSERIGVVARAQELGGAFHELPDWLAEMPHLNRLFLNVQLDVLSDAIWRRYGQIDLITRIDDLLDGRRRSYPPEIRLGIEHRLTDIPFSYWFRQNVYVPLLPFANLVGDLALPIMRWISHCRLAASASWVTSIPYWVFLGAPYVVLHVLVYAVQIALNLPAFLTNLLLDYAIEPAITAARDALGYSRMVHVRDLPAMAAPAPAAV